jgi:hypothetical protein
MKAVVSIALTIFLLTASLGVAVLTHDAHVSAHKVQEVAGQADTTLKRVDDYVSFQLDEFQSERYQKSVKATVDTGAFVNSVMRSINVRVVPELITVLRGLQGNSSKLGTLTVSLDDMVRHSDLSLNASTGLLPGLTTLIASFNALAEKTGLTIAELNSAIKTAADKIGLSLDSMHKLMADPAWLATLNNVQVATANVAVVSANVAEASKQMPSVAASLEKIAKTSSRFTKITLTANVLAVLASAFLPFLR